MPNLPPPSFLRALARRDALRADGTDLLRLVDGAGDGAEFAGLILEEYAGRWLVQTDGRHAPEPPAWLSAAAGGERSVYWKRLVQNEKAAPEWWHGPRVGESFEAHENGLGFHIDFAAGYSQGIFLDQRDNRRRVRELAQSGRVKSVLNLFAYTCAFSVAAAAGGAQTTSVDLSRRYLDWGQENFRLNRLDPETHDFLFGDVFDWLRRLAKRSRRFDLVIVDPPTFSRDRDGRVFRVEKDFRRLARDCAALVAPGGTLFCSTNARTMPAGGLERLLRESLGPTLRLATSPMPADFTAEPYLQAVWASDGLT